ncbi:MAG: hypothetical protein MUF75_08455 [Bacteroidia bacterium]|jgi:hypothetical protein|nr:hypothetical protein [Bacteroidia bacterium]
MDKLQWRASLLQKELFELFRLQLKKDFEVAGCDIEFTEHLPIDFDALGDIISAQIKKIERRSSSKLPELLYRIDISEQQVNRFAHEQPAELWEDLVAELIIKRVLQKVILKKTYSK